MFKAYATSLLDMSARWLHGFALVAAVLLLDVSLTFHNVWPTPAISWHGEISAELAAYMLGIIGFVLTGFIVTGAQPVEHRISSIWLRWITVIWILLVLGRYADVTAAALFGRDINLYWDLRFIPDVVSLLAKAAHVRLVLGAAAALAAVVALLYVLLRWALGRVAAAAHDRHERIALALI